MMNQLGTATLESDEEMVVEVVECLAGEYAEPLTNFLEHKLADYLAIGDKPVALHILACP